MLTNEKLNEHYKHFRKFTIKQSGNEIADLEKIIREVFLSHNEALEEIEKLKKTQIERRFKLFWKNGTSEILSGTSIKDAYTKAGYGGGSIRALDYYKEI